MTTKKRQKQLLEMKRKAAKRLARTASQLVNIPADGPGACVSINYDAFMKSIGERRPEVWEAILTVLNYFETHNFNSFGIGTVKDINEFVQVVYAALADENFTPNPLQSTILIQYGHLFQHLVASSSHLNNDANLRSLLLQQNNLAKVLFLENPRCDVQLNQSKFFDADPVLATMWFNTYLLGISTPTAAIQRNIYRHLENADSRWSPYTHNVTGTYFSCTYHNTLSARRVKGIINRALKKEQRWDFTNTPCEGDQPHIGIVSCRWHRNHAVYKSAGALVEQLLSHAKMTLVWTGEKESMPDTAVVDYFDDVIHCWFDDRGELHIPEKLKNNDFDLLYYPDIGMSNESVWLSNQRIAPIQAMGYGHPDTAGDDSEIDYFIGGDIEKDATDQYAETMVLLPGLGQHPTWPTYEKKNNHKYDGVVRVNCVWGPDKYNYTLLTMLQAINETVDSLCTDRELSPSKHEIHLFASPGINRYAAYPSFSGEISKLLPNAIIHNEQEYYEYMENAEMHDFSLNSFPFGCYNVLVESLFLGLPFLTIYGDRFYNRAGMWLNEQVGMKQNNFATPRDLINAAAELIVDPDLLATQRSYLAGVDLKSALFNENTHFKKAVDYILYNHPFSETKIIGDQNDQTK